MTSAEAKPIYTTDEYFARELSSEIRHEFINGEIIPMTGGTPEHNEITSILNAVLRLNLKGKPYSIFIADQRLWIPQRNLYTYPDVMVVPRPLERQVGRSDTLVNPILIAEVLSKSTKNYDRGEKFAAYRTLLTFQEYLLIDPSTPQVERYFKTGSCQWIFTEYKDLNASISLESIPCNIRLSELYEALDA
uniref:Uma2 family endonuclease n=1 Tax=Petrachloros mirabilis TaxID=2918835 RepID=UPI00308414D6